MTELASRSQGHHALKWLTSRQDSTDASFAAALDSLRAQQRHLQESLLEGFESRREVLEWCHAVDVVSIGQTPRTWHQDLVRDRWRMACFLEADDAREAISQRAPDQPETRKSVRRKTIRQTVLPAFRSATKMLRGRVGEFSDNGGVKDPDRRQHVAGRPRLHQRAIEQHRVLTDALTDPPRNEPQVLDWAEDVIHVTEAHVDEEFLETLLDRSGKWWFALTRGPSVRLEWLLAADVFPAMNVAISKLAEESNEVPDTVSGGREVPSG